MLGIPVKTHMEDHVYELLVIKTSIFASGSFAHGPHGVMYESMDPSEKVYTVNFRIYMRSTCTSGEYMYMWSCRDNILWLCITRVKTKDMFFGV